MAGSGETFTVVLVGFKQNRGAVAGLQKVFGLSEEAAQTFVLNAPVVVKRNAPEEVAQSYHEALRAIGATVQVTRESPDEAASLRTGQRLTAIPEPEPDPEPSAAPTPDAPDPTPEAPAEPPTAAEAPLGAGDLLSALSNSSSSPDALRSESRRDRFRATSPRLSAVRSGGREAISSGAHISVRRRREAVPRFKGGLRLPGESETPSAPFASEEVPGVSGGDRPALAPIAEATPEEAAPTAAPTAPPLFGEGGELDMDDVFGDLDAPPPRREPAAPEPPPEEADPFAVASADPFGEAGSFGEADPFGEGDPFSVASADPFGDADSFGVGDERADRSERAMDDSEAFDPFGLTSAEALEDEGGALPGDEPHAPPASRASYSLPAHFRSRSQPDVAAAPDAPDAPSEPAADPFADAPPGAQAPPTGAFGEAYLPPGPLDDVAGESSASDDELGMDSSLLMTNNIDLAQGPELEDLRESGGFEQDQLERGSAAEDVFAADRDNLWEAEEEEAPKDKGRAQGATAPVAPAAPDVPRGGVAEAGEGGLGEPAASPDRPVFVDQIGNFWDAVPVGMKAPLSAGGASWVIALVMLAAASLFANCVPILGWVLPHLIRVMMVGVVVLFFQQAILCGFSNDPDGFNAGSVIQDFQEQWADLAFRGLQLLLLMIILLMPAAYLTYTGASDTEVAAPAERTVTRNIIDGEAFYSESGRLIELEYVEGVTVGFGNPDGEPPSLLIKPEQGTVTFVEPIPEAEREAPSSIPTGTMILIMLCLCIPVAYLPMAFGIATASGQMIQAFNPLRVVKGVAVGGAHYAFILALGLGMVVLLGVVSSLLASRGADAFLTMILVGALATPIVLVYVLGVQGFLVGRLIALRNEDFAELIG